MWVGSGCPRRLLALDWSQREVDVLAVVTVTGWIDAPSVRG
jgi:hypothetical protein